MTATQDIDSKSPSRRALLAGALGGIGAWIASGIGRASPARAADGDPVLVGSENNSTSVTKLTNNATSDTVLQGDSTSGIGVSGPPPKHTTRRRGRRDFQHFSSQYCAAH